MVFDDVTINKDNRTVLFVRKTAAAGDHQTPLHSDTVIASVRILPAAVKATNSRSADGAFA